MKAVWRSLARVWVHPPGVTGIGPRLSRWGDQMAGTLVKTKPEGKSVLANCANLKGRGPNPPTTPSPVA